MTALELVLLLTLIFVSGFMSASEVALFSLSRFQLRSLKERFRTAHRQIRRLLSDPAGLLVTILVVNEVVNISISTLITGTISRARRTASFPIFPHVPGWELDILLGIVFTAPVVLLVCDITPKVIAARANQLIATLTASPMVAVYETLQPLRFLLRKSLGWIFRSTGRGSAGSGPDLRPEILKESEFLLMLEEGHREGAIEESEFELIKNVFEFDDTTVFKVLTPLSQVRSLPATTSVRDALALMRTERYSRLPVMAPDRKQVVGILYSKDLLRTRLQPPDTHLTIAHLMRKPLIVHPAVRLNALFRRFKQFRTHMAIVQGTSGDAIGIITMSDVLDTLFDDLFPEEGAP